MKIIIQDTEKLDKKKREMRKRGYGNLHIVSDFDRTLTYGTINGKKIPSIISLLRDGNHLSEDYAKNAHKLFNKYHPIEIDPEISLKDKKKMMKEWWEEHYKLLIKSGLSKSDLKDIVKNGNIKFRRGVLEFIDFLNKKNIPLIIFSSSGCGEAVQMFFQKVGRDYSNIYYLTNKFKWRDGKAVSIKNPIIHVMNKDETSIKKFSRVFKSIKSKKNVILLGDSIGDVGMIKGFNYNNLIKIGFLNLDYNKFQKDYKKSFDIILEGDGDFNYVNSLIKDLE